MSGSNKMTMTFLFVWSEVKTQNIGIKSTIMIAGNEKKEFQIKEGGGVN